MARRKGKSIDDIVNQSERIEQMLRSRGQNMLSGRGARVVNAFNRYYDNMVNSSVIKNIGDKDRQKNGGRLTQAGVEKQYSAKIGRSTYMGNSNG